ncbi:MAG TPA: hypothetical protein VFK69_14015 [Candidatus Eisenbacteria bacterium]|nr:hypothetical protein [Candidatus Eisenbacteria bacterium]
MLQDEVVLECPVCRCRLQVPARRGGNVSYTCRNGHRFMHDFGPRAKSWPRRHPKAVLVMVGLALIILFVARQWHLHGHAFPLRST